MVLVYAQDLNSSKWSEYEQIPNCINAWGDFAASTEHTGRFDDQSSKCIYALGKVHTYTYIKQQINNLSKQYF